MLCSDPDLATARIRFRFKCGVQTTADLIAGLREAGGEIIVQRVGEQLPRHIAPGAPVVGECSGTSSKLVVARSLVCLLRRGWRKCCSYFRITRIIALIAR